MDNQTKDWLDHVKKNSKIFSKDDLAIVIETLFQVGKINAEEYQVHCRIGSLEIYEAGQQSKQAVHCRIGSLEISRRFDYPYQGVHCRIGSLEK